MPRSGNVAVFRWVPLITTQRVFHWVTVTGWDVIYGEEYMTVSNWGKKRTYSYDKWIGERSLLKGAIYLTRNKCIDAPDMI